MLKKTFLKYLAAILMLLIFMQNSLAMEISHDLIDYNLVQKYINLFADNTKLTLRNLGDKEAIALAEALKNNNSLIRLDLAQNKISCLGMSALAAALKGKNSLRNLHIFSNLVEVEGIKALAELL